MIEFSKELKFPDFWQSEVVNALRAKKDVILHAPTGAGKTYAFELFFSRSFKGNAVYTVPTRALANDKFREWRALGWNVGIATGDYALNTTAPLVVATLETQKNRILEGDCADLLVIDEYQLISDPRRGAFYESAIALCPKTTQLMLLSGSVENRTDVLNWLKKIGRDAVLIEHNKRPVALEEIFSDALEGGFFAADFWGRLAKKIVALDMAPLLIFAPKRSDAESIAKKIAEVFAPDISSKIPREIMAKAGRKLAYLLKRKVAFHHSGLSAFQRSQIVETLAKSGDINVVVATTGLGAGINFSMRSVIIADREYESMGVARTLRADELLQMYGRAGRRGLDSVGYAISLSGDKPNLAQAHPLVLSRSKHLDWTSIIWLMAQANRRGLDSKCAACDYCARLFTDEKIDLGFDEILKKSQKNRDATFDASLVEVLNSQNLWQRKTAFFDAKIGDVLCYENGAFKKFVESKIAVKSLNRGGICRTENGFGICVRIATLADAKNSSIYILNKALRKKLFNKIEQSDATLISKNGTGIKAYKRRFAKYSSMLFEGATLTQIVAKNGALFAELEISMMSVKAMKDTAGRLLYNPPSRVRNIENGNNFELVSGLKKMRAPSQSVAQIWLNLGLVDIDFKPTLRGEIFARFNNGEGLAIAAALEDESYSIEEIYYDLANLRAGLRFEKSSKIRSSSSRLGDICRLKYSMADIGGYLLKGVPEGYGEGASEIVRKLGAGRGYAELEDEILRRGDIERAYLEWRSVVRHIAFSPDLDCDRFLDLKNFCLQNL